VREIKFRLWCKENEEMMEIRKMHIENNAVWTISCVDHDSDFEYYPEDNDHVLMQYTGLKDKNGREIYEGDIVKRQPILYTDCSRTEIEGVGEITIGEIYYVEGITIGIKLADGSGQILFPFHLLDSSQDFEVIGNVFENTELLEVNK